MDYTITCNYRSGNDETGKPWNENGDCGDFRSTIDFTISDINGKTDGINGIIVQYIQKSCKVDIYDSDGKGFIETLNTSDEIYNYTSGNVPYMNYNYLEYFNVINGNSVDGDQFGNGPICEYDNNYNEPIIDD